MKAIEDSAEKIGIKSSINFIRAFLYACLLHDIGHAPFSHTGEEFYLDPESSRESLHTEIISLTQDPTLENDIKLKSYAAAPHELMSVSVALRSFPEIFSDDLERSLFASCILGYAYVEKMTRKKGFFNCIISLLNSSVIDVDRLDYLIRDAYATGFDTVALDYTRLLKSIKIVIADGNPTLVFTKAAISVIENVVFAHDAERKWIQNHPTIQYDSYLLNHAIRVVNDKYQIFNQDALTIQGKKITDDFNVSLLSDADILFLMKNISDDILIVENFSRKDRRRPLWKSESEYKAIFDKILSDEMYSVVEQEFDDLEKYLISATKSAKINSSALKSVRLDIKKQKKC